jgi:hypothetical protein
MSPFWQFVTALVVLGLLIYGVYLTKGKKPTGVKNVVKFPTDGDDAA